MDRVRHREKVQPEEMAEEQDLILCVGRSSKREANIV